MNTLDDPNPFKPRSDRRSKLTPAERNEIRQRYAEGEHAWPLALEFGVSAGYIRGYFT